jgi:chromosome segregation ATPase
VATDFDPKECPVGLTNSKDIQYLGDKLDMAIEQLTEKVGDMKQEITTLNNTMIDKFDKVEARFDVMDIKMESLKTEMDSKIESLRKSMPEEIDKEVNSMKGKAAAKAWSWIFVGVGGSAIIYLVSRWIGHLAGL